MLPKSADVIVVGCGVIGSSIAYHLSKRNIHTIVLDKADPFMGSSGACDGMIFLQSKKPGIHLKLALESREKLENLENELGIDIKYRKNGGMIILENQEALKAIHPLMDKHRQAGADVRILTSNEALAMEPNLSKNVHGATFSPMDGKVTSFR